MGKCKQTRKHKLYVHDLDLFVTVQVPNDTPAVLSLGKLCEEHGYSQGQQSTADQKVLNEAVNLETITDMLSWYRIWPLNGFNLIRVKRKPFRRRKEVYGSFSNRRKSLKVIYTNNSFQFGKSCADFSLNHCISRHHSIRDEWNS